MRFATEQLVVALKFKAELILSLFYKPLNDYLHLKNNKLRYDSGLCQDIFD